MEVKSIRECGKLYNDGLYKPSDQDIIPEEELPEELKGMGIKAYNAGTDFKMVVRVMKEATDNSEQRWNNFNGKTKTDYMCVSYIRNDMQGTYAKDSDGSFLDGKDLTFGFSGMDEQSLLYTAYRDIGSYELGEGYEQESIESYVITEEIVNDIGYGNGLYSPDELIKKMIPGPNFANHNELGYRRIQNGEIKKPDYIVVSVKDGIIDVEPEILMKALRDWKGKLPVVIVDIDKCLEAERTKVEEMIQRYKNGEISIEQDIRDKIRSNEFTESGFCSDILEELNEMVYEERNQENADTQREKDDNIEANHSSTKSLTDNSKVGAIDELRAKIETFCRYGLTRSGKDYTKAEALFKDECKALGTNWLKEYERAYMRAVLRKKCDEYYMLPNDRKTSATKEVLKKRASKLGLDLSDEISSAEKRYWAIAKMKGRAEKGIAPTDNQRAELEKLGLNYEIDILGTLPIGLNPKESVKSIATSGLSRDIQSTQGEIKKGYRELENPELIEDKNKG